MACGILVSQPGIEPAPPAVEVWSLNHRTAREVPGAFIFVVREMKKKKIAEQIYRCERKIQ